MAIVEMGAGEESDTWVHPVLHVQPVQPVILSL